MFTLSLCRDIPRPAPSLLSADAGPTRRAVLQLSWCPQELNSDYSVLCDPTHKDFMMNNDQVQCMRNCSLNMFNIFSNIFSTPSLIFPLCVPVSISGTPLRLYPYRQRPYAVCRAGLWHVELDLIGEKKSPYWQMPAALHTGAGICR